MPEGHSIHRIARQFERNFVGRRVTVSSPQGRFSRGAEALDGREMVSARAVGKQLFVEFAPEAWLRVHLGIYGAWDFAGQVSTDATIRSASGRMGQTHQRGTEVLAGDIADAAGEDSIASIGAPRTARRAMSSVRMAEFERIGEGDTMAHFPPDPVGQVRVRLLTETAVADLRGPTACEVLTAAEVQAVLGRLGPDPLADGAEEGLERFVSRAGAKRSAIGLVLMDQSVVAGIGNVYRAEMLFRARLDPHTPANRLPREVLTALWWDWDHLLRLGVRTGQMLTMDGLDDEAQRRAMAHRDDRHWVYKREGLPCRVCGTNIALETMSSRKLYWCPNCQR